MLRYFLFFITLFALFNYTQVNAQFDDSSSGVHTEGGPNQPVSYALPSNFVVYTDGKTVINHPAPGFAKKSLMTNNDFSEDPGCYIACYSHSNRYGIYPVSSDIFVYGQIRVPGQYKGRICQPTGYENKDISAEASFKELCASKISTCATSECWAGGDTGGWFGIQ